MTRADCEPSPLPHSEGWFRRRDDSPKAFPPGDWKIVAGASGDTGIRMVSDDGDVWAAQERVDARAATIKVAFQAERSFDGILEYAFRSPDAAISSAKVTGIFLQ